MILVNQYGVNIEAGEITGNRMSLKYGTPFKAEIEDRDPESAKNPSVQKVKPQIHGYTAANRDFYELDEISLRETTITEYLFDDKNHFAGVLAYSSETRESSEKSLIENTIESALDDEFFVNSYSTTRLVGFRTLKRCDTSLEILRIEPIYYSVSEEMCLEHLVPISAGMLEEIPSYGAACNDPSSWGALNPNLALLTSETSLSKQ